MAIAFPFVCNHCARSVVDWSDGNPYYFDEAGRKCYAHHPDHENLMRCVGRDDDALCLACGEENRVDSRARKAACRRCGAQTLCVTPKLAGKVCPFCKLGRFEKGENPCGIS